MAEMIGVLTTAFLCGTGMLLAKMCTLRAEANTESSVTAGYILITKEHYETLKANTKISEQPQVQPPLPDYTEKEQLVQL
jgi:Tfp pilus assembly protein PilV